MVILALCEHIRNKSVFQCMTRTPCHKKGSAFKLLTNHRLEHDLTYFRLPEVMTRSFLNIWQLTVFSVVAMVSIMSVVSAVSPVALVDVVAIALLGSRVESINDSVGQSGGESTGGSVSQTMGESMTGSVSESVSNSISNSVSDSVSESLSSSLGGVLGSSASSSRSSTSTSSATSGMGLISAGNHVLLGSMVSVVAMVSPFFPTGIFHLFIVYRTLNIGMKSVTRSRILYRLNLIVMLDPCE